MAQHGTTVAGKKIEVILKDDTSVPDVTKRLAQELVVNDKVAVLAGFGITRRKGDEEDRAVRAGIAMLRALDAWNTQRISEGRKPMQMGIGMATDLVVSGNIGSPKRMDYTLIGDGVNLAELRRYARSLNRK